MLHRAAEKNLVLEIPHLLRDGGGLEVPDEYGWTPIHIAAMCGSYEALRTLADCGGNLEARDRLGRSPLFWAAAEGHSESVMYLARRVSKEHLNVDADQFGWTPLHAAAARSQESSTEKLLAVMSVRLSESAFSECLDKATATGKTALSLAAACGDIWTIDRLVSFGAALGVRDRRGWTAADWRAHGNALVASTILRHRAGVASQPERDLLSQRVRRPTPSLAANDLVRVCVTTSTCEPIGSWCRIADVNTADLCVRRGRVAIESMAPLDASALFDELRECGLLDLRPLRTDSEYWPRIEVRVRSKPIDVVVSLTSLIPPPSAQPPELREALHALRIGLRRIEWQGAWWATDQESSHLMRLTEALESDIDFPRLVR